MRANVLAVTVVFIAMTKITAAEQSEPGDRQWILSRLMDPDMQKRNAALKELEIQRARQARELEEAILKASDSGIAVSCFRAIAILRLQECVGFLAQRIDWHEEGGCSPPRSGGADFPSEAALWEMGRPAIEAALRLLRKEQDSDSAAYCLSRRLLVEMLTSPGAIETIRQDLSVRGPHQDPDEVRRLRKLWLQIQEQDDKLRDLRSPRLNDVLSLIGQGTEVLPGPANSKGKVEEASRRDGHAESAGPRWPALMLACCVGFLLVVAGVSYKAGFARGRRSHLGKGAGADVS
jgi:hypothetical protein